MLIFQRVNRIWIGIIHDGKSDSDRHEIDADSHLQGPMFRIRDILERILGPGAYADPYQFFQ
jgi:hypothetical protein